MPAACLSDDHPRDAQGTNYVEWWPFQVPPPAQYAASSKYFPSDWNNDMVSRCKRTRHDRSGFGFGFLWMDV